MPSYRSRVLEPRLRPHTFTHPKVLLNVAGKPILGHILDKIIAEGVTDATIVVGHMSDKIMEYVRAAYPHFPVTFAEQEMPLGWATPSIPRVTRSARIRCLLFSGIRFLMWTFAPC